MPDRDAKGHFVKGNKASPGRKPRVTEAEYMEITIAAVSPDDWSAIVEKAVKDAKKGAPDARRWLSDYVLGKPPQILELRGTDAALLADLLRQFAARGIAASDVFNSMLALLAESEHEPDER